jgi:hypothetical protein
MSIWIFQAWPSNVIPACYFLVVILLIRKLNYLYQVSVFVCMAYSPQWCEVTCICIHRCLLPVLNHSLFALAGDILGEYIPFMTCMTYHRSKHHNLRRCLQSNPKVTTIWQPAVVLRDKAADSVWWSVSFMSTNISHWSVYIVAMMTWRYVFIFNIYAFNLFYGHLYKRNMILCQRSGSCGDI